MKCKFCTKLAKKTQKQVRKFKKGDTIGIISPAGAIKKGEDLSNAIALLTSWGLKTKLGKYVFGSHHHFAGTDEQRLSDFQTFLDDDDIKAIWFARGGYGSIRIIDKIDFTKFQKNPKWIIGYSDFTVIHQALNRLNIPSIHAFMPTSSSTFLEKNTAIESLKKVLFKEQLTYKIPHSKYNKLGKTNGEIIGGNLTIISSLLGTKYSIEPKNKILFIEDIGEYKYRIDRVLQSLKLNGYFEKCAGLIVGSFTHIPENDPDFGMTVEALILDVIKEYNFPVCFDFPAGHIANNNALIFGNEVLFEVGNEKTIIKF